MNSSAASPKLSVVVIGRNEGSRLLRCLDSVLNMDGGDCALELIYVDSGSDDDSVARAQQMGACTIALHPDRPTAALGRNAGWRSAAGEFILFLDGDTVLAERFAADSLPQFRDPTLACVWGHRRELHPEQSIYNRVLDLDWIYAPGFTPFCGGDAIFRRSVLEQVGGFDETLIAGEEPDLCRRILDADYRILHVDRPMTQHDLAITHFSQYWRRAIRAGHAYAEVAQRFANTGQPFWTEEVRRNRVRAVALTAFPALALAASLALRSWWPVCCATALFTFLTLRTAIKARWKSDDAITLLLYGAHSHLQQLPIALGQVQFSRSRRRGQSVGLVEYKRS